MARKIASGNVLRIRVELAAGAPLPRHARIAVLDNSVHRVINPRWQHTATFHDLPPGPTVATASVGGRLLVRKHIVVPEKGELEVTLRASGADDDGHPFHGSFTVVDEHSGEPLRGRKYRITSDTGICVTGETDRNGETRRVGTDEEVELHLELLDDDDDDDLNDLHPEDGADDADDDDDDDGIDLDDVDNDH